MNNEQVRVLNEALIEVAGCFEAAQAEGLEEALMNATDDRLRDLVERRLMYAFRAAQPFTPRVFRDGDAICAVWPDFIDLQTSPAGFGDTKEDAIRNLIATSAAPATDTKEALRTEVQLRGHIHMLNDEIEALKEGAAPGRSGKLADDMITLPIHLIASACYVIRKTGEHDSLLAKLRAYTTGEFSRPPADSSSAAPSEPDAEAGTWIECWACKKRVTEAQRADADGNCPHCGVEISLDTDDAAPSPTRESLSALPPLTWLYTHCKAIGMTCVSDSGKWEHDIALFTINLKEELRAALATPRQTEDDLKAALIELAWVQHLLIDAKATITAYQLADSATRQTEDGSGLSASIMALPYEPVTGYVDAYIVGHREGNRRGIASAAELASTFAPKEMSGANEMTDADRDALCQAANMARLRGMAPLENRLRGILRYISTFAPKEPAAQGGVPEAAPTIKQGWQPITAPGQVKVGDKLRFTIGDDKFNETVKLIIRRGQADEEIIYNKARNYYVITSMCMKNAGSSKNVEFLPVAAAPGAAK